MLRAAARAALAAVVVAVALHAGLASSWSPSSWAVAQLACWGMVLTLRGEGEGGWGRPWSSNLLRMRGVGAALVF